MSREHDTVPDLLPTTEADTTVDNTAPSEEKPSMARQAEIDEMLEFLANRRPPIRYREGADSNGQDGARYFTQHEPAKRADLDTDPGSNVIVRDSIREKTPPMAAATTQPLIAPSVAGPNGTDPMWPPVGTSNQASIPSEQERITPLPEPTWGQLSRARRAHEKTMLVAEPAPRRRLAPWHVGLLVAASAFAVGVLALILLYATKNVDTSDARRANEVPSDAKPSASPSPAKSKPTPVLSTAPVAATNTLATPTPVASLPTVASSARPSSTVAPMVPRPPPGSSASAAGTQRAVPRPVTTSNGAVPDQEKEN